MINLSTRKMDSYFYNAVSFVGTPDLRGFLLPSFVVSEPFRGFHMEPPELKKQDLRNLMATSIQSTP